MSVISAFTYLFSADTSKVDDGLKKGDKAADDLKKSLDQTDKTAQNLATSFADLAKGALAVGASFLTWGTLKAIAVESAALTNELDQQSRALRLNADDLAVWTGVIEKAGGSASEFQGTIKGLMERFGGMRDPLDALMRVADRFKGLNDRQADRLGANLGLDRGTVEAMRNGADGLQKLIDKQRALGMVTKEQLEVARKFKLQQQDLDTVTEDIRRRIATLVLPILTKWLEYLQNLFMWMRDKKEFIMAFFGGVATVIGAALLPALVRATIATWAFIAPWAGIVAAVTAVLGVLALVIDDIHAFRNGADSLIGEISKNWPVLGVIINELCDALEILFDLAAAGFQWMADMLFRPQEAMKNFQKTVSEVMDRLAEKFPFIHSVFEGFARAAEGATKTVSAAFSVMWAIIKPIVESLKAAFDIATRVATGAAQLFNGEPQKALPPPSAARSPNSIPRIEPDKAEMIPRDATVTPRPSIGPSIPVPEPVLRIPQAAPAPVVQQQPQQQSKAPELSPAVQAVKAVESARPVAAQAAAHPLSSTTSNTISNMTTRSSKKETTVNIEKIDVQTQATDPKGVADALGKSLQDQLRSANDEFDDGIVS